MTQQRCSFCRAPANQVEKIIFGTHFNICSDCIRTCLAVLDGEGDTGWTLSTSPQRCNNCDRRPSEGYRHVMNRATYSPRICERCIRLFTEMLLRELPTIEEELQAIFQNVFETDDETEQDTSSNDTLDNSDQPMPEEERDPLRQMRNDIETKTREQIDNLTQTLAELETHMEVAVQTQPAPKRLKNELKKPLGVLFDFGDTLLTHLSFNPEAGTDAVLKIAHNPKGYRVEDIHQRLEKINRDLIPRREQAQIEFHPHLVQRHVYEALHITFDRDPAAVERIFWRASMQWKPEPDVEKMLQVLQSHTMPMGVVSNASFTGNTLWWELERQNLSDYFRFLMSSADYWVRKPHPLLLETAAAKLDIEPSQVWYVGNSPQYDIAAAHNAGMGAIWYNRQDAPCDGPDPHVEVKSWQEFTELIKQFIQS
jgi:putative hydrolase of the HAD superfamily